ncbi:DUF1328 domain-containing protein [Halobaculum halobium]|uniref:UPF0391 membrane protein ACFQFD_06415 n=1 Tax=Halobaculum halobium TaxID=3032281 RepID=A0ABD5TEM9_9EURY|nr:DUF1328 domain-containing protein [Halobaculum sp. SYNS20]
MVITAAVAEVGSLSIGAPLQFFSGEFLQYAVVFFVLAIIAAVLGARGVAGVSMTIAKWLVIVFLVLTIATLIL